MIERSDSAFATATSRRRFGLNGWLEGCVAAAVAAAAMAAVYAAYCVPNPGQGGMTTISVSQTWLRLLAAETDPIKRDALCLPASATCRAVDAFIPTNSSVFLAGVLGPENTGKLGFFYFLSYYLFPQKIAISLGTPARCTLHGMAGRVPESNEELGQAGYDLVLESTPDLRVQVHSLHPLPAPAPETVSIPLPERDGVIALLLPLAVALAGRRLARLLFRDLAGVLSEGEWLAGGLALGAFFSTQAILGLRLAGARLEWALAIAVAIWGTAELVLVMARRPKQVSRFQARQLWWLLLTPTLVLLWLMFRLAGLAGLTDYDAVAFWSFKAKVFHALAGSELSSWFKNPALGYAHLDYPLVVPLLHSFTYGAIGHVNEFVTKFWNQWMLLFLAWAILGVGRFPRKKPWLSAAVVTVLILLPATQDFARKESATLPMTFFAVISSLQLALGLFERQPGRLRLGLLLLLATAMVKFEGMLLLAMWVVLLLLDKDARSAFWPLKRIAWVGLLGLAGWIPYVAFRLQGPVPHPESAWLSLLIRHAGEVIQIAPMTCLSLLARRFLNNDLAAWSATDNQHAVWQGQWTGLASLFDQATLGIAWVCVLMMLAAWSRGGTLRWAALKLGLVFLVFASVISIVWSSTHSEPLDYVGALDGSADTTGGRYLYPVLLSWFVAGAVLLARAGPRRDPTVL